MYKGHMDKAKGGRFEGGRGDEWDRARYGGVKMETTALEQQFKKLTKKHIFGEPRWRRR